MKKLPVTIDTADFKRTFYGILNGQNSFWTPLVFESEDGARKHIINFWGSNTKSRDQCLRTHKIVPVQAVITLLSGEKP